MKTRFMGAMASGILLVLGAVGCSSGKPGFRPETLRPDQTHDFAVLYRQNCSACHGDRGRNGAALPLDNPVYLAWAPRDRMIDIVSNGVPHRSMPAFGQGGGGLLTNRQVEDIVDGMISHWSKPGILDGANAPSYAASSAGDVKHGKVAFQTYCARCHGADGQGIPKGNSAANENSVAGSIVDPTYLSLVSRQGLRDIVVSGFPGENMPGWRGDQPGQPMTDKDVTDVVAWLVSQRQQLSGGRTAARESEARSRR